jgi:ribose-phosphate pyrophosphokinase
VTSITTSAAKQLVLVSGRAHPELAAAVARELGCSLLPTTAYDFANGEIYVRFAESVRGADAFVLQSHATPVNHSIMEQLLMVDALKRASAHQITAILPFYGYARQDKKHRGREPISARLLADLFHTAGADRLMSVDLHAAQTQGFFDGPVDHLWAMPILTDYVRTRVDLSNLAVVSPDAGRIRVAEKWAAKLGDCPLAFVHKTRDVTRANVSVAHRVVGEVQGRDCVLVDDLIDTGGTIAEAVKVLLREGARGVIVAATHGVLSDPAPKRLQECGAREVIITDTLPIGAEKRFDRLRVLSIAPLIARAIREVFDDGSVTSLFDGNS